LADLTVHLFGRTLDNPTVLASGILGVTKSSIILCAEHGAGAVTIKSITRLPRKGHPLPIACGFESGLLNAVGYSGPGYASALEEFAGVSEVSVPVIGSIVAENADEYAFLARQFIDKLRFWAYETPLSCPHTPGYGELAGHSSPDATYEIVKSLKRETDVPVIVKLSANVRGLGEVARAAEQAGADAICAVNTLGPGRSIDPFSGKTVLGYGSGGISGPALKPVAIRCVFEIFQSVKIPIIGTGGVSTALDAVEMLMAGATLVGIGTAVVTRGLKVFAEVTEGLRQFMTEQGYERVSDLTGLAHGD
jgi:dihydroorotate dehydrogenase (NAD+) catalytic subunit